MVRAGLVIEVLVLALLAGCGGRSGLLHGSEQDLPVAPRDSRVRDAPTPDAGVPDRRIPDSRRPDQGLPAPDLGPPKSTWGFSAGGPGADSIKAMAVDRQRSVYITGAFVGSAKFGKTTLKSAGSNDLYLARLGPDGQMLWALGGGGKGYDCGLALAVGPGGDIYLSGEFNAGATLGGKTFTSRGSSDVLLARVSPAGQVRWVATGGGTGLDRGLAVAVDDKTGVAFLAGSLTAAARFGAHNVTTKGALQNAFVAGVTAAGAFTWARTAASDTWSSVAAAALAPGGWVYLAGHFGDQVDLGGKVLKGKGNSTGFLAAYDRQGKGRWAGAVYGSAKVEVASLDLDSAGGLYAAGTSDGEVVYGPLKVSAPPYVPTRRAIVLKTDTKGAGQWLLSDAGAVVGFGDALAVRVSSAASLHPAKSVHVLGSCSGANDLGGTKVCTKQGRYLARLSSGGKVAWSAKSMELYGSLLEVDDHGGIYLARSDYRGWPTRYAGQKLGAFGQEDILVWKLTP